MLPEIISNNLASLQPNRVRYAKSVFIEFTAEGARRRDRSDLVGHQKQTALQLRRSR